ncbi:MAG: ubiquitin-like domain-containing protein [Candidatus Nanogingivalis sp.]
MWNTIIKYPLKSHRKQFFGAILTFSILAFGVIFISQTQKPVEAKGEGSKIITVFENGERIAFKTDATTVKDALSEQNIILAPEDNVEPALDEKLTDTDYSVNIYRASPYLVADGEQRVKVMTAAKTPKKIAEAGGLKIFDEDIILSEISQNPLEDGTFSVLKIQRAKLISVKIFGKTEQIRTQANTIAEFLTEKKIKLGNQDGVSKNQNEKIKEGDHFEIWRNGKQTLTVEEEIPFETEKIQDASKDVSFREVKTAGENGKKTVTYEIEMRDGVEISRTKITEVEIRAAKKQVEVVGTKVNLPAGSHEDWMAAAGISASDFGYVNFIITKESTWRPTATNGQYYGLYQTSVANLQKHGCTGALLNDPICQLKSANIYRTRYGTWEQAYNAWLRQGWW